MATELVLLSEVPLDEDLILETASRVLPEGTALSFRDGGVTQVVDGGGQPVLTVFGPTTLEDPEEARTWLVDPPEALSLWTELAIPFAASEWGLPLAGALADAVQGEIKSKF